MGDASSPPLPPATGNGATPEQSSSTVIPIRILTHNIRFATDNPDLSEKLWPDRFPHLSSHFKYHTRPHFAPTATLVCMQEVLHGQLVDLHQKTFNTSSATLSANDWTFVGVGRDDGKTKGEYSPIFFRQSAWKCIHFETVWLNETGEVGKKGWDADSIRILTCAVLESVLPSANSGSHQTLTSSSKLVLAMNTHLDNEGEISRRESAKVILGVASRLRARFSPGFTFLCGDLNSQPDGDAYQILNAPGSGFVDTRRLVADDNEDGKTYAFGNDLTYTGFPADPAATGEEKIDFVHLGVPGHTPLESLGQEADAHDNLKGMVQSYGVLPNRFDDRVWLSDHRAVVVDLLVQL
ncbi:hypothetical protein PV04_09964 [Phialophora macrospora]|uniref:Endonuclease/exonuclease/phosphatase domain-containing protein n=1 Tax=Phialophora macrospora TaxID=1851006 RepID=A0A0D2DL41_9EURO|nr:hypothetical protein PV04_09964 [Phialophora macrospora]